MRVNTLLNAAALPLGLLGLLFKVMHWEGSIQLLVAGFGLLLSAVGFTGRANAAAGVPAFLNYTMVTTLAVSITATLFRIMQWDGYGILLLAATVLMMSLSLLLLASKAVVLASRQFVTVTFVFCTLLFLTMALLSGRSSRPTPAAIQQQISAPHPAR